MENIKKNQAKKITPEEYYNVKIQQRECVKTQFLKL